MPIGLYPRGFDQPDAVPGSPPSTVFAEVDVGTYTAPTTPPAIWGALASVATSDEAAATPWSGVTVTAIAGVTETVKLPAAANGTLTDAGGGSYNASAGTHTIGGTAAAVIAARDAPAFTPTAHGCSARVSALLFSQTIFSDRASLHPRPHVDARPRGA